MTEGRSMQQAASSYLHVVTALADATDPPSVEQIVDGLIARDRLAFLLQRDGPADATVARTIRQGDDLLRSLRPRGELRPALETWRDELRPQPDAWWWEHMLPSPRPRRYSWLWTIGIAIFLTLTFSLITDMVPRFLSGGPDVVGVLALLVPSLLSLFVTSGSVLVVAGVELGQRLLERTPWDALLWPRVGAVAAAVVFGLTILLYQYGQPFAAHRIYYPQGVAAYQQRYLVKARADFERALKLDPTYLEAHYWLGVIAEDLDDRAHAKEEYWLAIGNIDQDNAQMAVAYNNLGRLYLQDGDFTRATALLREGRNIAASAEADTQYVLLKNLGWSLVEQHRYGEALPFLDQAISLDGQRAEAYCVKADALEQQGQPRQVVEPAWGNCLKYAAGRNQRGAGTALNAAVDQDAWIGMAQAYLATPAPAPVATGTPAPAPAPTGTPTAAPIATAILAQTATLAPAPNRSPSANMLIVVEGQVQLRRQTWNGSYPVNFGTILDRGDLIELAPGGHAEVLCDDLTLQPVPVGSAAGITNLCPPPPRPLLERNGSPFAPGRPAGQNLPYIISPRATRLLNATPPPFVWNNTGAASYTVALWADGKSIWQQSNVTGTTLQYPGQLRPGVAYVVVVADSAQASSSDEGAAIGFSLLDDADRQQIRASSDQIKALRLPPPAEALALAQLYSGHDLLADAIQTLSAAISSGPTPTALLQALADRHAQLGLLAQAQPIYERALTQSRSEGDIEQIAEIELSLGKVALAAGDRQRAAELFATAKERFTSIGDTARASVVELQLQISP